MLTVDHVEPMPIRNTARSKPSLGIKVAEARGGATAAIATSRGGAEKGAISRRKTACTGVRESANLVNGVTDVLKSEIYSAGHEFNRGNPEAVNCLSGEIELHSDKWMLRPHCREHYRTTQIPVEHNLRADTPLFRAFLAQVFRDDPDRDDKIKSTLELMGYTLMSHEILS